MATIRQIEANQRNAQSSTGPKTEAGKAVTAMNALKHGMLAGDALLPGESAEDFQELAEGLYADMKPVGELENALVARIVGLLWRLARMGRLEAGMLRLELADADPDISEWKDVIKRARTLGAVTIAEQGNGYIRAQDSLAHLSRYEASLDRNLSRALRELDRSRTARNREPVPAPVVVDVDVTEAS